MERKNSLHFAALFTPDKVIFVSLHENFNTNWKLLFQYALPSYIPQNPSPSYNVTELKVPIALFTGGKDWLADPQDVAGLIPLLNSTGKLLYHKNIDYYNHLDFVWGMDAAVKIYPDIIEIANKMRR